MTISVRLPQQLEQSLAKYCVARKVSKTDVVKEALDRFLAAQSSSPTPYELGKDGFGSDETHRGDIARHSKRLLRERVKARR